ncbi:hypothetical protein BC835DRAFT_1264915 [Cytidiella melzeri]|nr:hypothetical protein BC835DRAFT_1264915 [Cytidiella melzeri]
MALNAIKQFRRREVINALKDVAKVAPKEPVRVNNPFLPRLNPETGRWAPAKYSLRRQADLVKKAKESNTLHLLPPGLKLPTKELKAALRAAPQENQADEVWTGAVKWEGEVKEKKVAGAEVGNRLYAGKWRMFKGHKWQRVMKSREEKREKALKVMNRRIKWFKGTYQRRRPSPLDRPKATAKLGKLPF